MTKKTLLRKLGILALTSAVLASPLAQADIVKWIDENGKVHYGDRVPEKYKDQIEIVEQDNISVVSPESKVARENRRHVNKLRAEDHRRERAEREMQRKITREQEAQAKKEAEKDDMIACRNRHPSNVKRRTECFLAIDRAPQE